MSSESTQVPCSALHSLYPDGENAVWMLYLHIMEKRKKGTSEWERERERNELPVAYSIEYSYEKFIFFHCVVSVCVFFRYCASFSSPASCCYCCCCSSLQPCTPATFDYPVEMKIENAFLWTFRYHHCTMHGVSSRVCALGMFGYVWMSVSLSLGVCILYECFCFRSHFTRNIYDCQNGA